MAQDLQAQNPKVRGLNPVSMIEAMPCERDALEGLSGAENRQGTCAGNPMVIGENPFSGGPWRPLSEVRPAVRLRLLLAAAGDRRATPGMDCGAQGCASGV